MKLLLQFRYLVITFLNLDFQCFPFLIRKSALNRDSRNWLLLLGRVSAIEVSDDSVPFFLSFFPCSDLEALLFTDAGADRAGDSCTPSLASSRRVGTGAAAFRDCWYDCSKKTSQRERSLSISMSRALSNGPKSGALSVVSGSILSAKTGS